MTGGFLNDDERKARLSFVWLSALAALSGYTCERGAQPDVSSVDAVVRTGRLPDGEMTCSLRLHHHPLTWGVDKPKCFPANHRTHSKEPLLASWRLRCGLPGRSNRGQP